jgi:hypothetical protein
MKSFRDEEVNERWTKLVAHRQNANGTPPGGFLWSSHRKQKKRVVILLFFLLPERRPAGTRDRLVPAKYRLD